MTDYERANSPVAGSTTTDAPAGRGTVERPRTETGAKARAIADDARHQASAVAHEAKEQGKAALERRKHGAAGQLDAVAGALHESAEELYRDDKAQAGRFIEYAADRLESFGRNVRDKNLDTMIDDAARMARRSPAAFFAGSMAAGFLLARFLKSSADARQRDLQRERSERQADAAAAQSTTPVSYPTADPVSSAQTAPSGSALTSADFRAN